MTGWSVLRGWHHLQRQRWCMNAIVRMFSFRIQISCAGWGLDISVFLVLAPRFGAKIIIRPFSWQKKVHILNCRLQSWGSSNTGPLIGWLAAAQTSVDLHYTHQCVRVSWNVEKKSGMECAHIPIKVIKHTSRTIAPMLLFWFSIWRSQNSDCYISMPKWPQKHLSGCHWCQFDLKYRSSHHAAYNIWNWFRFIVNKKIIWKAYMRDMMYKYGQWSMIEWPDVWKSSKWIRLTYCERVRVASVSVFHYFFSWSFLAVPMN